MSIVTQSKVYEIERDILIKFLELETKARKERQIVQEAKRELWAVNQYGVLINALDLSGSDQMALSKVGNLFTSKSKALKYNELRQQLGWSIEAGRPVQWKLDS